MPISTKLLAALEHRMRDFIESRGAKDVRPLALTTGNSIDFEVRRIVMQRLIWIEMLGPEHQSDAHRMEQCYICQQVFNNLRGKYEGMANEFMAMNRDLLGEIELSH